MNNQSTEHYRNIIISAHKCNMKEFYEKAEQECNMDAFWNSDNKTGSHFVRMFNCLDLSILVELACGKGRHFQKYENKANKIILVDPVVDNIDFCKNRFKDNNKITYYQNNGYDLSEIPDNSVTCLFTYDSMVHFEMIDILNYLREIYRILQTGKKALFHHSNNYQNYNATFQNSPGGRSFMSDKIFAHMAIRCGFNILEQKIIDWSKPNLDCITLVEK